LSFSSKCGSETNLLLSALGKCFKKSFHAFSFAAAAFFATPGDCHHFAIILNTNLFVKYNMVVLTLVAQKNGETITFEDPIPKVHFMKLISCSLYNSWYTLKKEGSASLGDIKNPAGVSISNKLLPGHYDLERLAKEINGLFENRKYKLETEINTPVGQLVIKNFGGKNVELDRDLADLLGIQRKLKLITFVKKLSSPTTYFIHCDLIDTEQNIFNGKKSDLLARFDIKGKPFEKVTYNSCEQQVLRDCSTDKQVNSINLSVKDKNGELFDFNGFDMEFELELN